MQSGFEEITGKLAEKTESGDIVWRAAEAEFYLAHVSGVTYRIRRGREAKDYALTVKLDADNVWRILDSGEPVYKIHLAIRSSLRRSLLEGLEG